MPIPVRCGSCGQGHKAPEQLAGKSFKCRKCGEPLTVPASVPVEPEFDPAEYLLQSEANAPQVESKPFREPEPEPRAIPSPVKYSPIPKKRLDVSSLPPLTTNDPPLWRRHLHWLLVLTLLPLAVTLLRSNHNDSVVDRLEIPVVQQRHQRAQLIQLRSTHERLVFPAPRTGLLLAAGFLSKDVTFASRMFQLPRARGGADVESEGYLAIPR